MSREEKWCRYANHLRSEVIHLREQLMQLEAENEVLRAHVYARRDADTGEADEGCDRNANDYDFENGRSKTIAA